MFDLETFIDKIMAGFPTLFDARIDAVNLEKNPGGPSVIVSKPWLDKLQASAYFFNSLDDAAHNYRDFAFIYLDTVRAKVEGPSYVQEVILEFDLFLADRQDLNTQKMLLRYERALLEAMAATWNKIGKGYDKAQIESVGSVDYKLNNSSYIHKVIGAQLTFSIANG
jgi:hypothetical protein